MKQIKIWGLATIAFSLGVTACNNGNEGTASTEDSTTTTTSSTIETTAPTSTTSSMDYAAMADTFTMGNNEGRYLDARTGKPIKINVDRETGRRTNAATGEPVWRYIDNKTWWVYGGDEWDTLGTARMEGGKVMYRGDNDTWDTYDKRWPEDEKMQKEWKEKIGDTKIKVSKDGDMKIKTEDGKVKYDADDRKVKVDSSK